MFISTEVLLTADFHDAWAQLTGLLHGRMLVSAAQDAYSGAITGLAGPSLADAEARLVEVQFRDVVTREGSAVLALRWNAIGPGGRLFPALDADIVLTPAGEQATLLRLNGVYRPPPGIADTGPEHAILHGVATGTAQSFISGIAKAIAHPAHADQG